MQTINSVAALRTKITAWRQQGQRIAFVPTMGNLHDGHLKLVEKAASLAQRIVVSVFVNPTQFNDEQDYNAYPITLEADSGKLAEAGIDVLFAPTVDELYPFGLQAGIQVSIPGLSDILEGESRPGHFVGMTTIVSKLFNAVMPDIAVFGEKDFQQFLLVQRLVADLCLPIEVVACPTQREDSGLAMSSRNSYLNDSERKQAALLYQLLDELKEQVLGGASDYSRLCQKMHDQLLDAGFRPEYVELRCAKDLSKASSCDRDLVVLASAWLGSARLIDNLRITLDG